MSKNKFYYGDIVKLKDKDIWGIVTNREDLKPNLVIETILPDHYAIDNIVIHQSKLETAATPLAPLTKAKLKSMVQGRPLSSLDYVRFYSLKGTADYTLNAADIFKGVDKLLNGNGTPFTADTFNIWSLIIEKLITEAYPEEIPDIAADGTFKDADMVILAFQFICSMEEDARYTENPDYTLRKHFDSLSCMLESFLDAQKFNNNMLRYNNLILLYLVDKYNHTNIDNQSEAVQMLFKNCLEELCRRLVPEAIEKRGYCYYCGTKVYPNDWFKARDSFLEYYERTAAPSAANTLGYIYYYGRCNNGTPEYDKAFYYFSIGHAAGIIESTYKLGDMFKHGNGVKENQKLAFSLYQRTYNHCLLDFCYGNDAGNFADIALRMGECYFLGIMKPKDATAAYEYYLQANLAIQKRMEAVNYYGDDVVSSSIKRGFLKAQRRYHNTKIIRKYVEPEKFLNQMTKGHRRCQLIVKKEKNDKLRLTFNMLPWPNEMKAPKLLLTSCDADYCNLADMLKLETGKKSHFINHSKAESIIFNEASYGWHNKILYLYLDGVLQAELHVKHYRLLLPKPPEIKASGRLLHFASISFQDGGKRYDYLCDDKNVKPGDKVVVTGYNGETAVSVVDVFDEYESHLKLPFDSYKKILKVLPASDDTELIKS